VIIQPADDHLLLVTQPDHAALAGTIMAHWCADGLPESPRRDEILLATRAHDDGWYGPDDKPIVDPETGRVLDFVRAPADLRQALWSRGVARLSATPYAAALVAEHALQVYHSSRDVAGWTEFFAQMRALRDDRLSESAGADAADLSHDYAFLRMGDLLSLMFCGRWLQPQDQDGYALQLQGDRLVVAPDPFEGQEVPLSVTARVFPNHPFPRAADAWGAFERAEVVTLTGVALGA
jgi:hypothetical protein